MSDVSISEIGDIAGIRCLILPGEGTLLGDAASITSLIGDALGEGVRMVVVPATRLDPAFFRLRTGVAGEFLQKLMNYRLRLAIVGDGSAHVAASDAFRDLVVECERGDSVYFVADLAALEQRLAG